MAHEHLDTVKTYLLDLQERLCDGLARADSQASFRQDEWDREEGGGGRSRVIEQGGVFEKGGVNFSHVFGTTLPPSATAARPELAGRSFHAVGVSWVLHPENPHIPTSHGNVRFFIAEKTGEPPVWWFGGGYDLTLTTRFLTTSSIGTRWQRRPARRLATTFIHATKPGATNISISSTVKKPAVSAGCFSMI